MSIKIIKLDFPSNSAVSFLVCVVWQYRNVTKIVDECQWNFVFNECRVVVE